MRTLASLAFALAALGFTACGTDNTATYHDAITGAACAPDMSTYAPPTSKKSKHPGCDSNHCCLVVDGECDGHPDAMEIPTPP